MSKKLISDDFSISKEGTKWLRELKPDEPIFSVAVAGNGRCGKSFLSSVIAAMLSPKSTEIEPFKTSNQYKPHTKGVDMYVVQREGENWVILDCEGINNGSQNDASFFVLFSQLATTMIYVDHEISTRSVSDLGELVGQTVSLGSDQNWPKTILVNNASRLNVADASDQFNTLLQQNEINGRAIESRLGNIEVFALPNVPNVTVDGFKDSCANLITRIQQSATPMKDNGKIMTPALYELHVKQLIEKLKANVPITREPHIFGVVTKTVAKGRVKITEEYKISLQVHPFNALNGINSTVGDIQAAHAPLATLMLEKFDNEVDAYREINAEWVNPDRQILENMMTTSCNDMINTINRMLEIIDSVQVTREERSAVLDRVYGYHEGHREYGIFGPRAQYADHETYQVITTFSRQVQTRRNGTQIIGDWEKISQYDSRISTYDVRLN